MNSLHQLHTATAPGIATVQGVYGSDPQADRRFERFEGGAHVARGNQNTNRRGGVKQPGSGRELNEGRGARCEYEQGDVGVAMVFT